MDEDRNNPNNYDSIIYSEENNCGNLGSESLQDGLLFLEKAN